MLAAAHASYVTAADIPRVSVIVNAHDGHTLLLDGFARELNRDIVHMAGMQDLVVSARIALASSFTSAQIASLDPAEEPVQK